MKIGIDIDGVITDIERFICDYGTKFLYENNIQIKLKYGKYDEVESMNITPEQSMKFWNKYLEHYATKYQTREFAVEVIKKLKENNEIHIITARDEQGLPGETYGMMKNFVKRWLEDNKVCYDKLIFKTDKEKLTYCLENKIDVMIEDSPNNIVYMAEKMPVMAFDCGYNRDIKGNNIIRVYSWYDILQKLEQK